MDFQVIASILTGSLGTIFLNSLIDQFSKKKEHSRSLEKFTYERKINIAESAIAFYSHYRYNVLQMASALVTINQVSKEAFEKKDIPDLDLTIIQDHMNNISNIISEMFATKYQNILSMNLYFDFSGSTKFKQETLIALYTKMGIAKSIDTNMQFFDNAANDEYNKGNNDAGDFYNNKFIALLPSYSKALGEVIEILDTDSQGAQEVIEIIKSQLKLY